MTGQCTVPRAGWRCTRAPGHEGPCAAIPASEGQDADEELVEALRAVDQTVLGAGNPRANCFQACLAMLFGLPIGECIDVTDPAIEEGQWIGPVEQWAATKGWRFVTSAKAPKDRPYIAIGPTANREGTHGVVCVGKEMFHDPHPSRDGIVSANFYAWLEPAALSAPEAERAKWDGQVADWLRGEATTCDCFAREPNECACGAWDDAKRVDPLQLADAIRSGAYRQEQDNG